MGFQSAINSTIKDVGELKKLSDIDKSTKENVDISKENAKKIEESNELKSEGNVISLLNKEKSKVNPLNAFNSIDENIRKATIERIRLKKEKLRNFLVERSYEKYNDLIENNLKNVIKGGGK